MNVQELNRTQLKNAYHSSIMENAIMVTTYEYPLVDNGFGMLVPDLSETPEAVEHGPVRIVKQTQLPFKVEEDFGTTDTFYLLAKEQESWMKNSTDIFTDNTKYTIDAVEHRTGFQGELFVCCRLRDRTFVGEVEQ